MDRINYDNPNVLDKVFDRVMAWFWPPLRFDASGAPPSQEKITAAREHAKKLSLADSRRKRVVLVVALFILAGDVAVEVAGYIWGMALFADSAPAVFATARAALVTAATFVFVFYLVVVPAGKWLGYWDDIVAKTAPLTVDQVEDALAFARAYPQLEVYRHAVASQREFVAGDFTAMAALREELLVAQMAREALEVKKKRAVDQESRRVAALQKLHRVEP